MTQFDPLPDYMLDPPDDPPDPDLRIAELEREVARLRVERDQYGWHLPGALCRTADEDGCECGWGQVTLGTLWDHVGDSENIHEALESWND